MDQVSSKFLSEFNELEKWLKSKTGISHAPTLELITRLKDEGHFIGKYFDQLRDLSNLRNFVVHNHNIQDSMANATEGV